MDLKHDTFYLNPAKNKKKWQAKNKTETKTKKTTTAGYDRNIVGAVKKNLKRAVSDISIDLHRAGVKDHFILQRRNTDAVAQDREQTHQQ